MLSATLARVPALPSPSEQEEMIACHACGLVHRLPPMTHRTIATCTACGTPICRRIERSIEKTLALYLGALLLFVVANAFPFMTMSLEGNATATTILDGARALYREGMWPVALVVLLTGTVMPLLKITGMLYVLLPLQLGVRPKGLSAAFRWIDKLHPWSMMEVYLLGVIVAYVKLSDLATIHLGYALYAFVAAIILMAAGDAALEAHAVWRRLAPQAGPEVLHHRPGTELVSCHECDQLVRVPAHAHDLACPRCTAPLHKRKVDSITRTWALVLTAAILYLPANLYPVMTVVSFGHGEPDTILSGIMTLLAVGMWPVALLVFFASITVPVLKLLGLAWLLITVQRGSTWRPRDRTLIYRIIEGVGRWSMVDVFMIAILTALVSLGNIATIVPGPGAIAFCAVVIVTMLASMSFDPRLIWDAIDERSDHGRALRA
ncbi:paraquat-inducible protein A [Benzoatithermus flavus]|uniref:Paraquat-inducible protein A n=1 Tax=Benzoatithermus flavus TaxID=3108223 RepID=A0ABU8XR24_9PROT